MKLYEAHFSFEFSEGGSTALFPSRGEAVSRAKELLQQEMDERKGHMERFGLKPEPDTLTAEISEVTVGKITKQLFCDVVNSQGGSYSAGDRLLLTITLTPKARTPKVTRAK